MKDRRSTSRNQALCQNHLRMVAIKRPIQLLAPVTGALWVMALALLVQFSTRVAASEEALWRAIEQGDETAALALVRSGNLDVKARNAAGDTPLHRAAEKGMRSLAESLLARGAEVNARAKNGETPLHFAALDADASVAELLLDAGADGFIDEADLRGLQSPARLDLRLRAFLPGERRGRGRRGGPRPRPAALRVL